MQRDIGEVTDSPSGPTAQRLPRHVGSAAAVLVWVALVCADAAHGPGPWLWAAVAATWAALPLLWARVHVRHVRRTGGRGSCQLGSSARIVPGHGQIETYNMRAPALCANLKAVAWTDAWAE